MRYGCEIGIQANSFSGRERHGQLNKAKRKAGHSSQGSYLLEGIWARRARPNDPPVFERDLVSDSVSGLSSKEPVCGGFQSASLNRANYIGQHASK